MDEILEVKVKKAVELIKKLQTENSELNKRAKSMTVELEAIKSLRDERDKLKKNKEEIKRKVEEMLNEVDTLTKSVTK